MDTLNILYEVIREQKISYRMAFSVLRFSVGFDKINDEGTWDASDDELVKKECVSLIPYWVGLCDNTLQLIEGIENSEEIPLFENVTDILALKSSLSKDGKNEKERIKAIINTLEALRRKGFLDKKDFLYTKKLFNSMSKSVNVTLIPYLNLCPI